MQPMIHYVVAVEPKPPHTVTVFSCTPNAQTSGHKLWRSLWETLMVCEQSNNWPGYANIIMPLDVPDDEDVTVTID